ncbi:MAG: RNA 2',3'-cyclic phosphodiesterase, partial [Actinomycetota bacterium]
DRPFRPPLTLSRIRPEEDVTSLLAAMPPLGVVMPVDRIVLYRSHLGRGGASYQEIEEFPLG